MNNNDIENFLEDLVSSESDHSKLNKDAIKNLMDMSARERLEYVNSMGNIPLDNEGRQLVSCPKKGNAICALYPIYEGGSTNTVCTGPLVRKKKKTDLMTVASVGLLGRKTKYKSESAHSGCPYNPENAKQPSDNSKKDDELEDLFD